jgi:hypothetical protein
VYLTVLSSEKRQSNSTDVSSQNSNQNINQNLNGQDLNNGQNLDLNGQFNVNGLDFSNLNANSLNLGGFNVQDILNALSFQILEQELLGSNNGVNSLNSLNLGNVDNFQLNGFNLNDFNSIFNSQFSVESIFQLLEGLQQSNVFNQNNLFQNNGVFDLNGFSSQFNSQFSSNWQSNQVLALVEAISGNQNLQQLVDLAQLSQFSGLNNVNSLSGFGGNNIAVAQIEAISI